tara:strand:- start:1024 stop:1155 length:132 start_codon:yes stop_codon:yes gene_type:complete
MRVTVSLNAEPHAAPLHHVAVDPYRRANGAPELQVGWRGWTVV